MFSQQSHPQPSNLLTSKHFTPPKRFTFTYFRCLLVNYFPEQDYRSLHGGGVFFFENYLICRFLYISSQYN